MTEGDYEPPSGECKWSLDCDNEATIYVNVRWSDDTVFEVASCEVHHE